MRPSGALSLVVAAAGSHVAAQTTVSTAPPTTTLTPEGPVTGKLGNATVVENNPPGVVYQATFPDTPFFKAAYPDGGNIKGTVIAVANPDGIGVLFKIKWTNLPKAGGPFMYHLHVAPIPENGNCTAALAHLDPFVRGEDPVCDKKLPQTCQAGDLSGKYGDVPEGKDEFETSYVDLFSSTVEGLGSFFGNRSIVFHYANKTRVSCANFVKVTSGGGPSHASESLCSSTATTKPTGTANLTTTGPAPTGASPTGKGPSQVPAGAAATGLRATGAVSVVVFAAAIMFML